MKQQMRLCFLLLSIVQMHAQQLEDAWVYFEPKEDIAIALANPETFLTQRALDRKQRHGVAIDQRDVPLNQNRVTQVKNMPGITVLAQSKWFNCVYVRGTVAAIKSVTTLDKVARIDFADNSLDASLKSQKNAIIAKKTTKKVTIDKFQNYNSEDYGSSAAQIEQLNAHVLHENGYTGTGIVIAVMDSGFPNVNIMEAFALARSENRLLDGYDFVSKSTDEFAYQGNAHGTWTFSDIGAKLPGTFVGTAPDAFYRMFRTEDVNSETPVEEAYWVAAAERADSLGVDVINTSLGYNRFDNAAYNYETNDMNGTTAFISKGTNIAFEKGMIPVSSAGNSGSDTTWGIITAPGDAMGSFTVGAIDAVGTYAAFSSRGPTADNRVKPDVVARGSSAAVIQPDNSIGALSGTSFSGPIMAGAVACLWQAFPDKTNAEIVQMIRSSASQFADPTTELGYGIPNFGVLVEGLTNETFQKEKNHKIFPNPVQQELSIVFPDATYKEIKIFSAEGRSILQKSSFRKAVLDLEGIPAGMYFVTIHSKSIHVTQKIIKL